MGYLASFVLLLGLAAYLLQGGVVRWITKTAKVVDPVVVGLPTGFVGYLALRSAFGDREVTGFAARLIAGFYFLMGALFLAVGGFMLWFFLLEMFPQHFAASSSKAKAGRVESVAPASQPRSSLRPATEAEKAGRFAWVRAPEAGQAAASDAAAVTATSPGASPLPQEESAGLLPSLPEVPLTPVSAIVPVPKPRIKESARTRERDLAVSAKKGSRRAAAAATEALPPGVERMSKNWCPPGIERNRM